MRAEEKKPILSEPSPGLSPLPEKPLPLQGFWRFGVPLLVVIYLALALLHAKTTPTGLTGLQNAPDEQAHYHYVLDISKGHLPTQQSSSSDPVSYEWHQPPLYYLLATPFSLVGGVFGVRLFSILCGLCGLLLIYQTLRVVFPSDGILPVVGLGLVALNPSHIALTSTVNNDALLEVCFSATFYLLSLLLLRGVRGRDPLWLGMSVGCAFLTKATGIVLIPLVLYTVWLLKRNGEEAGQQKRLFVGVFGLVALVAGWWFVRNGFLYGELLPLKAFERAFAGTAMAKDLMQLQGWGWDNYLFHIAQRAFQSFWAVFGTVKSAERGIQLFLPNAWYALIMLWACGVCVGMTRQHFLRAKLFTKSQIQTLRIAGFEFGLVLLSYFTFILKYYQAQGRYLYPAMLPIALIGAVGWLGLFPNRYRGVGGVLLLGYLALFTGFYFMVVVP